MTDLVAWGAFVLFALLVVVVWRAESNGDPQRYRAVASLLIGWCVLVSFAAGLSGRQAWPFTNWRLMSETMGEVVEVWRVVAVDSLGAVHAIDHRAWAPLSEEELLAWLRGPFSGLSREGQAEALGHLLGMAERGRARAATGGSPAATGGILGPLGARTHILHPDRWAEEQAVPTTPFVGLEVVADEWNVLDRRLGDPTFSRRTLYTYPSVP